MILSVIATVYNQAEYVAEMIESVLAQEVDFEYEFIIADDASIDKSADIIQSYADQYKQIIFIKNDQNLGVIRNYAQLLKHARGTYIADIGGDDKWIYSQKLQMQVDYLRAHADVGMVYTQFDTITTNTGAITKNAAEKSALKSGFLFDDIICFDVDINVCTSCFRRELILSLIPLFEQGFFPYEDTPMWLTISQTHKIMNIPISTLSYRINDESISHSVSVEKQSQFLKDTEAIRRHFIPDDFDPQKYSKFEDVMNAQYFVVYLKDKVKRKYYYHLISKKGSIIRVLNAFPFDFVLRWHQVYKRVVKCLG